MLGVMDQVTIINSTLGKALGGAAGTYRVVPRVPLCLGRADAGPIVSGGL